MASTALLSSIVAMPATAQSADADEEGAAVEEIVTVGSRRPGRSAGDSPAPVDVIGVSEFRQSASSDVQDLLRTAVPSFNVNSQPISDAATIIRPANLRGLSPDNTLVLINGKRRHRGSVISFLGGGIADGAQGVDISAIPSLALKRVEVLRDGASSQYGSDAIAGVLNFVLRDDAEGGQVEVSYGSTYAGDGDNYRIAANLGLPIGDTGFVNLTAEYGDTDGTVRSVVRDDVLALIAAGNEAAADFETINSYTDEAPQYWGTPDVEDDIKVFVNSAITLSESLELYAFGSYAERTATGGFFYRNPTNRGGVYRGPTVDPLTGLADPDGVASVLVGDLDGVGVGEACPAGIPLTGTAGLIPDADILAQVVASENCFSFIETIPGGFVPRFGGDNRDYSISGGVRGEFEIGEGLTYDLNITHGSNRTDFFIRNTLNASLGPDSPRDFVPGGQEQIETVVSADFVYAIPSGFASDINFAFGGQYREETFDLFAGDPASFALGPLADQGFSSSSNGFGGFPRSSSNSQDSYAAYIDVETDITEDFTFQAAVRYEDYNLFGDTIDYKFAFLYRADEHLSIRGAISTGFHAPTAGQANITNVTTQNVGGVLVDQGTLPLSSAAGQLAADFIESQGNGRPGLTTEEARNISFGLAFDWGESSWTVDFFDIKVDDRVALGANVNFLDALNFAGGGSSFTTVSEALTGLDAQGVINRQDFIGLDDLSQFRFFSNSFSTKTQGIDVVGRYPFALGDGDSNIILAANYTRTEVTDVGTLNPISAGRIAALEDLLPNIKGSLTWTHAQGPWNALFRVNYYGGWDDTGNGVNGIGAEWLFDVELAYEVFEGFQLVGGVDNLLSNHSDRNPFAGSLGQLYPEAGPFGFNGGQYYLRARYQF